jgi:hypothetical protein
VATTALRQNREALDSLLSREALPPLLRQFVMQFAQMITERSHALGFVRFLGRTPPSPAEPLSPEFEAAFQELENRDRASAELLSTFVRTGAVAMTMQWPETARMIERHMLAFAASDHSSTVSAAAAVRRLSKHKRDDSHIDGQAAYA